MTSTVALTGHGCTIDLLAVDLGNGEQRYSAVMCGAGFDAEMMAAPEARRRRLGWGAYAVDGDLVTSGARLHVRVCPAALTERVPGPPPPPALSSSG